MKKRIKLILTMLTLSAAICLTGIPKISANAASVTVTDPDSCRIRKEPSTSSEAISSVKSGKVLEVVGEATGTDGFTWYQVKVEGTTTGYIRADLVSTPDGNISTSSSNNSSSATSSDTAQKAETAGAATESKSDSAGEVVDSEALAATVTADTVTVRENATTKSNKVGTAKSGQELSINGEATDSEGKTWYKINFEADGKTVDGFIRSDFLEVTSTTADLAPEEPESVEQEAEPEPTVSNDYEVKYEANAEGVEEWFLYDHINGNKQSINNIKAVMEQSQNMVIDDGSEVKTMKIVIIVMAVIMLLLIIGIAILLFRLRDRYEDFDDIDDEDYDDEEEDEEEIEEMDEEEEYESRRPVRKEKKFGFRSRRKGYEDYEDEDEEEDEDEDEEEPEVYTRPVKRSTPTQTQSRRNTEESWSSGSLMDIDDDMEFEFLDLDN